MLLQILIAALGAWVALDLARRLAPTAPALPGPEARRWLAAAALALGSTLWALQVLGTQALALPFAAGVHTLGSLAIWACGCAVCAGALAWVGRAGTRATLGAAALLALAALASQAGALVSLGLQPTPVWSLAHLFAAGVCSLAGGVAAMALLRPARHPTVAQARAAQAGSAALLAVAWVASQRMMFAMLDPLALDASAHEDQLPLSSLHLLAALAVPLALAMAGGFSVLEARLRMALVQARNALNTQHHQDSATGLPNRARLDEALARAVAEADAQGATLALLFIGLDGFRPVNELLGQAGGDRMLGAIGQRLHALAAPHLVARQGGDEFVLLMRQSASREAVTALANQVLQSVGEPYAEAGLRASVSCSIGIALYPEHGSVANLMSHANVAMRAAKRLGGASYSFFDARNVERAREQGELLRDLRLALARNELQLVYQPKIHAPSGQVTGVEALMRWNHPQRGMVSPVIFVPVAERYGLINAMGDWVIDEACRQAGAWRDCGLRMRVAVNLSVHQLNQAQLVAKIAAALQRHAIQPHLLTCEITESVALENTPDIARTFEQLSALGVHLSIDDFGSGYSSLGTLRKLPASELKIDRSFVLDLETSDDARKVVAHVVNLAKSLNLQVVAEGVETDAQYQVLRRLGVDQVQGYLFAKPMSGKAMEMWAINDRGPTETQFRDSLFVGDSEVMPL